MPASIPAPTTLTSATTLGDTHSRMHGRNLHDAENVLAGHPTWKLREYPTVMHIGSICTLGIACPPFVTDRSLLDFIDVNIDPKGFAHAVFTASEAGQGGMKDGIYILNQKTGPGSGVGAHS